MYVSKGSNAASGKRVLTFEQSKQFVIHLRTLAHRIEILLSEAVFGCRTALPYRRVGRIIACASLLALIAVRPLPGLE